MEQTLYDVVIIGSGPAGMTAAVYASRGGLSTLLLEHDAPGGKLVKTQEIQNWPGIIETGGPQLAYSMYTHALAYGAIFDAASIVSLETDANKIHTLTSKDGRTFKAKVVILATGTQERTFDLPNREKYDGRGISYCAVCDGAFYRGKEVAVFGGGNSALEEARYLTQFASKVYLVHRRQEFRGDQIEIDKVKASDKIELVLDSVLATILEEDNKFSGVIVENKAGEKRTLNVSGMFVYIGATPRNELVAGKTALNNEGNIIVDEKMKTEIPGVYAVGDVIEKVLRQVVTATGDGAIAGQDAYHYITAMND
ncbi:thioredoxin reductase [Erysipelotrichaceae bacterium]|nr:thioredoxin reductase [Erysipelotrichaceae bacterium]